MKKYSKVCTHYEQYENKDECCLLEAKPVLYGTLRKQLQGKGGQEYVTKLQNVHLQSKRGHQRYPLKIMQ